MSRKDLPDSSPGYLTEILKSFVYPFTGDGPIIMLGIGLVAGLVAAIRAGLSIFRPIPFIGTFAGYLGMLGGLVVAIMLVAFFREIILESGEQRDKMPTPGLVNLEWDHIRHYLVPIYALLLLSNLPSLGSRLWVQLGNGPSWIYPASIIMTVIYLPMALLLLIATDDFFAANPLTVGISILRAPFHYIPVLIIPLIVALLVDRLDNFGRREKEIVVLSITQGAGGFLVAYLVFVWARTIGIFYRFKDTDLGLGT